MKKYFNLIYAFSMSEEIITVNINKGYNIIINTNDNLIVKQSNGKTYIFKRTVTKIKDEEDIINEEIIEKMNIDSKRSEYINTLYNICPDLKKIFLDFTLNVLSPFIIEKIIKSIKRNEKYKKREIDIPKYKNNKKIDEINDIIKHLKGRFLTIKGYVQSGKTNFIICASILCLLSGYSVAIILRDYKVDQEQIHVRILEFMKKINSSFSVTKSGKINKSSQPSIYLALGNANSINKVYEHMKENTDKYILMIDEVDYVDSSTNTLKNSKINIIKENAHCIFGISATIMDPIGKTLVTPKDLILLTPQENYKGIPDIFMINVPDECKFTSKIDSDLFETDCDLYNFIKDFDKSHSFTNLEWTHPNICLIRNCTAKRPYINVQERISKEFPDLTTIVYNGNGIICKKGDNNIKSKGTISDMLQTLKDNDGLVNHKRIIIFAGNLAGRSISFVSRDYKWHLTHQRLLVSDTCDEAELIQLIRLLGVYNDNIPLYLYTTEKTWKDLCSAHYRQEEIINRLKLVSDTFTNSCKEYIENNIELNMNKFTKRSIVKDKNAYLSIKRVEDDDGWDIKVYKGYKMPPSEYFTNYGQKEPTIQTKMNFINRIKEKINKYKEIKDLKIIKPKEEDVNILYCISMYDKWINETTKVARFFRGINENGNVIQRLDPYKTYTNNEFKQLCDIYDISIKHLCTYKYNNSKGYGCHFNITMINGNKNYKLKNELVDIFELKFRK